MVVNVAPLMQNLEVEDFYLLSGLEHGMRFSDWVDRGKLPDFAGLNRDDVAYRLDRCLKFDLIERRTIQYEGYQLKFEGYDALALHTLAERETVTELGVPLGVGKESDVLEARGSEVYALKFHREGITNFREVHRERDYTADREHISWLYTARKAAEREYEVLTAVHPRVAVPEPIDHNRHVVVMERLDGRELSETKLETADASALLLEIFREIGAAYDVGFVHVDLSAYNIIMTSEGVRIIDWPQAVPVDHPNARELLDRDVENVVSFFRRKLPTEFSDLPEISCLSHSIRFQSPDELVNLIDPYI